jgi:Fe-Mn family superoxide dismutase
MDNGKMKIIKTSNADNPIAHNLKPVFGIDVWEHAYYLDYQNRREDHVLAIVNNLANWDFAEYNLQIE